MRILVSIENEKNLEALCPNLCGIIAMLDDEEIYIDILHVYQPVQTTKAAGMEDTLAEIKKNEHKLKVKFIASCENKIEEFLQEKLDKTALVNSYLLEGEYKQRIHKHIIFHTYNLLVLMPREKVDFNAILQGRNTHWAIDNLEVPVLLLPNEVRLPEAGQFEMTCFIDDKRTYQSLIASEFVSKVKKQNIEFLHFGRHEICEGVKLVHSSDITSSLQDHTACSDSKNIFVLVHKNKGDFLNFLNKSFTKSVIKSMENPLLIY